jgi:hypothetical protein
MPQLPAPGQPVAAQPAAQPVAQPVVQVFTGQTGSQTKPVFPAPAGAAQPASHPVFPAVAGQPVFPAPAGAAHPASQPVFPAVAGQPVFPAGAPHPGFQAVAGQPGAHSRPTWTPFGTGVRHPNGGHPNGEKVCPLFDDRCKYGPRCTHRWPGFQPGAGHPASHTVAAPASHAVAAPASPAVAAPASPAVAAPAPSAVASANFSDALTKLLKFADNVNADSMNLKKPDNADLVINWLLAVSAKRDEMRAAMLADM